MNQNRQLVVRLECRVDVRLLVVLVALNVAWLIILRAISAHFQDVAGYPQLDLRNSVSSDAMITPSRALAQIATYMSEARLVYWSFFLACTTFVGGYGSAGRSASRT